MAIIEKGLSGPSECGGEKHDSRAELKGIVPDACAFRRPESPYAGHAGSRNARSGGKPIQGEKVVGRRRVEQALEQRQSGQVIRRAGETTGERPASGTGLFPIHIAEKNLIARQGQRLSTRTAHRSGSKHKSPLVQPLSRRHADQGGGTGQAFQAAGAATGAARGIRGVQNDHVPRLRRCAQMNRSNPPLLAS